MNDQSKDLEAAKAVCAQCESNARDNEAGGYHDLAKECREYCRRGHRSVDSVEAKAGKDLAGASAERADEAPDSVAGQPPQQRGWELISDERERQQTREGWNADHDDEHENGELALAANCYRKIGLGSHGHNTPDADQSQATEPDEWPWGPQWWKPKTRLRNLVRAGALYQAEIDRLCRVRMQVTEEIDALLASKPDAETA